LKHLLGSRNGHTVIKLVLALLEPTDQDEAMAELSTKEGVPASPEELELLEQIVHGIAPESA